MHEPWAEKFWERVRKSADPNACWEWTGSTLPRGYGRFYPRFKVGLYAHRISWEMANGREIPSGLVVMHACDNPRCVNPSHLSVGTPTDNMQDCAAKGRTAHNSLPGERHPNAKLTDAQVTEIRQRRACGERRATVAATFGVSEGLIKAIVARRAWRHLP